MNRIEHRKSTSHQICINRLKNARSSLLQKLSKPNDVDSDFNYDTRVNSSKKMSLHKRNQGILYEPQLYANENFIKSVVFEENTAFKEKRDLKRREKLVRRLQQSSRLSSKHSGATSLLGKKNGTGTAKLAPFQDQIKPNIAGAQSRIQSSLLNHQRSIPIYDGDHGNPGS